MLGQIATSVNHEIRTPLNALYMNLQLIKKALQTPPAERGDQGPGIVERVALIDQEVTRISDILEEFVRYARIAPPNPERPEVCQTWNPRGPKRSTSHHRLRHSSHHHHHHRRPCHCRRWHHPLRQSPCPRPRRHRWTRYSDHPRHPWSPNRSYRWPRPNRRHHW